MKKLFLLTLLIASSVIFCGCQKTSISLAGTTWSRSYRDGSQVLEFLNKTECQVYETDALGNIDGTPSKSTYSISSNGAVVFNQPSQGTFGFVSLVMVILPLYADTYSFMSATITNNIMTVTAKDTYSKFIYSNGKLVDITKEDKDYTTFTFMKK